MTDSVREAEIGILRYLLAHHDARDTVEGIEKWWLPQSRPYGMADICTALRQLESDGLISVWKSASAKPVYGLRVSDSQSIEEYLSTLEIERKPHKTP